jgi:hypothetical protein
MFVCSPHNSLKQLWSFEALPLVVIDSVRRLGKAVVIEADCLVLMHIELLAFSDHCYPFSVALKWLQIHSL